MPFCYSVNDRRKGWKQRGKMEWREKKERRKINSNNWQWQCIFQYVQHHTLKASVLLVIAINTITYISYKLQKKVDEMHVNVCDESSWAAPSSPVWSCVSYASHTSGLAGCFTLQWGIPVSPHQVRSHQLYKYSDFISCFYTPMYFY